MSDPKPLPEITTAQALAHLRKASKDDPTYRRGWIANLSMSIYDECPPEMLEHPKLIEFCHAAAERFMSLLEKE